MKQSFDRLVAHLPQDGGEVPYEEFRNTVLTSQDAAEIRKFHPARRKGHIACRLDDGALIVWKPGGGA